MSPYLVSVNEKLGLYDTIRILEQTICQNPTVLTFLKNQHDGNADTQTDKPKDTSALHIRIVPVSMTPHFLRNKILIRQL